MVIAYGNKVEYNNIFTSIKVLITDETAIIKNEYKIPEYIEKIIVYGYVYENNNVGIERIKEGLKNGNELIDAIKRYNNKLASKILEREEININQVNNYGHTALMYVCMFKMESVALKLLEREKININQVYKGGNTALILACRNNMESVALKLLEREEININQVNKNGYTALYLACFENMPDVALKLIDRMSDEAINKWLDDESTALYWACYRNNPDVAIKLIDRMSDEAIIKKYKEILNYVKVNNMEEVEIKLNDTI